MPLGETVPARPSTRAPSAPPSCRSRDHARGIRESRIVATDDLDEVRDASPGTIWVWKASPRMRALPRPGTPSKEAGAHQLAYIDEALDLVTSGRAVAIVTAPVSKDAIATSG